MKKRILSGAQPTGELHLGNYIGALKNWVALQEEYESFFCIVNLHAITLPQNPAELRKKTLDLARVYLASGVDPQQSTVFVQSDVPQHAELAWVLNCVARMGELQRMTQIKDKFKKNPDNIFDRLTDVLAIIYQAREGKNIDSENAVEGAWNYLKQEALSLPDHSTFLDTIKKVEDDFKYVSSTVGLFTYPILMAADILLYQSSLVPVGQDQKQHLELTRDIAWRFNRDFGETFVIPEPFIPKVGAKIMSLAEPLKKMSKSDENLNATIFLNDSPETILKKFKKAQTDSATEIVFDENRHGVDNLLTIYQVVTEKSREEIETHFSGKGYGHLKVELAEAVIEYLRPFQAKMAEIDDTELEKLLKLGAEKARSVASQTLQKVYENVGLK
jgi:tryptophanyl-tRNA synthetase